MARNNPAPTTRVGQPQQATTSPSQNSDVPLGVILQPSGNERNVDPNFIPQTAVRPPRVEVKAKEYRVVEGAYITTDGMRAMLRKGRTVSDAQYNIQALLQQGVLLDEIVPIEAAPPAVAEEVTA